MMKYKNSIYRIFLKLSNQPFPYITIKECNLILIVFEVVSTIYDKCKPKGKKAFILLVGPQTAKCRLYNCP